MPGTIYGPSLLGGGSLDCVCLRGFWKCIVGIQSSCSKLCLLNRCYLKRWQAGVAKTKAADVARNPFPLDGGTLFARGNLR